MPGLLFLLVLSVSSLARQHSRHSREGHRKTQPARSIDLRKWSRNESLASSRWRREPNPVALSELDAGNQDQNTHRENKYKPEFLDCSKLNPTVEEEAERGAAVVQVRARDKDAEEDPNSPAGQIEFSIVSTHKKFKIDAETGWLSTNTMFNRDEPDREKLVHVTVKASDHGKPPLEDVCTIAVKINDINDNPPIFDRANYDVPVAQDTEVGRKIMRVSATDVDEGDNQKITYELRAEKYPADIEYFRWDEKTGEVWLSKKLDKPVSSVFVLKATAKDGGIPPKSSEIDVTVEVKESSNKPPMFRQGPGAVIELSEGTVDYSNPIATYTADSQIKGDPLVYFELVNGRTEQTNKAATFRAVPDPENQNQVNIYLAKPLEYEKVNSYTLTLQVRNNPDLVAEAQLNIKVTDENNQSPVFNNIESGSVLEHEPAGTVVMQVQAIDGDGSFPNNRVTYRIDDKDPSLLKKFSINPDTGTITTKEEFDREEKEYYALTVIAEDGSPSSLLKNGKPNQTPNKFRIVIKDKNDNPPYFPQQHYTAEVPEDADIGSKVIEVKAEDLDTEASVTTYSIKGGNLGLTFKIEPQTGFIRVNKPLDYENINEYTLTVTALDGQYSNDTTVHIKIQNRNDMKPEFLQPVYTSKLKEEEIPTYPILQVTAIDPDVRDRNAPQNITYFLDKTNEISSHFAIDPDTGALRIIKPLDRDRPDGYPVWSMYVYAKDSFIDETGDRSPSLENFVGVKITLEDINDNAPFLDMPDGLVWYENEKPGTVGELIAEDFDTIENGPPYTFALDKDAPKNFRNMFGVKKGAGGKYYLETKKVFDREEQKVYQIPIRIEDNKGMAATSVLTLVIGDKNDNPMAPGASKIFVYNYEGRAPDTDIGRVFVNDPDDWDLPDKTFRFKDSTKFQGFGLNMYTGMITMKRGIKLRQEVEEFFMEFIVEDPVHNQVGANAVSANVSVTVQRIPQEAVMKSGSIRLDVTPEKFISQSGGREKLTSLLQAYLNATYVDVFTVLPANNGRSTDVRFAAHGSPYFPPERMEVSVARRKTDLERQLGVNILMIHIDECMVEGQNCEGSCYNELDVLEQPTLVMTNTTSFVGVTAKIEPTCGCPARRGISTCQSNPCLNGGTCEDTTSRGGYRCICPDSVQFGPNCEKLAASFRKGWTTHKGFESCENTSLSFVFTTKKTDGLLLYQGPSPNTIVENVTDFFALELEKGKLKYFLNFGDETWIGELEKNVADDNEHLVQLRWSNESVSLIIDGGACSNDIRHCQLQASRPGGDSQFLNSNGPLQVGGLYFGEDRLRDLAAKLGLSRHKMPVGTGFAGCMKNLSVTQGSKSILYSLGNPADFSDDESYKEGCDLEFAAAVVALNMNMNFLIAILVCLAVILTAVIVMAMYRRRRTTFSDKDIDCDIRENIINYEDEGGGEGDQTGYDLSVLRMMAGHDNGGPILPGGAMSEKPLPPVTPGDPPDIQTFLNSNKDRVDADPEANPYDDLRHYAYEGDGNSGGSLSSLNSGEDDADLEFEYLHNFGPRFKKLADMYGRESDSESEQEEGADNPAFFPKPSSLPPPGSESWC